MFHVILNVHPPSQQKEKSMVDKLLKTQSLITQPGFTCSKLTKENQNRVCEIWSKLTIKIPERCHWRRSGIFIVNFEHISHLVLVFLLLTLNMLLPAGELLNIQPKISGGILLTLRLHIQIIHKKELSLFKYLYEFSRQQNMFGQR